MTTVMKVSKSGYDVLTAANSQLSFNSELATHSIFNIITVNKGTSGSYYQVEHNLGYTPKAWVFLQDTDAGGTYLRRIPRNTSLSGNSIDYYIDSSDVMLEFESATTAYTLKVIIFTRSANI